MVARRPQRNWHASWWEWHLLMAFAFAFVYYSAHVQYAREGLLVQPVPRHLPPGDHRADPPRALRRPGGAGRGHAAAPGQRRRPVGRVVADLADRFELTEGQAEVLEQAAQALVAEREQIERLRALVAVGAEARVIVDERRLLERGVELTGQARITTRCGSGWSRASNGLPRSMRAGGWRRRERPATPSSRSTAAATHSGPR